MLCELRLTVVQRPTCQRRRLLSTPLSPPSQRPYSQSPVQSAPGQRRRNATALAASDSPWRVVQPVSSNISSTLPLSTPSALEPDRELSRVAQEITALDASSSLPSEATAFKLLSRCRELAYLVAEGKSTSIALRREENTATSALLSLQESSGSTSSSTLSSPIPLSDTFKKTASETLSRLSNQLLSEPKIFITPRILQAYVSIQSILKRPEHFPEAFSLYATKPIPRPSSFPITYSRANPRSHKNAIAESIADLALEAVIARKNLPLALSIIDTTFCAPAFYRSKILRKAAMPMGGLALAPIASYAIAAYFAQHYQNTMDPGMATNLAFAAILSYIGFTAIIGIVAVTTANDQMVRVTWAGGMPLRERWLREEERAALDRVAVAWGFKEEWKRGMEEGAEWESLREFIGRRGMVLDASNLMQGME